MSKFSILHTSFEFSNKLGVRELPQVDSKYQSNVKGLYIVGDLVDAPIIKVALKQGYEVAKAIIKEWSFPPSQDEYDVCIVGAGPAGIGAALALAESKLSYVILERESAFSTIQNFPMGKKIFSEPKFINTPGSFWFEDASKEELVDRWKQQLETQSLPIKQPVEVTDITPTSNKFVIHCANSKPIIARRVILATGKRGEVQKLNIPGEDSPILRYALKNPMDHVGQQVLVVGGGDSAVENSIALANAGAKVTLTHRGNSFYRVKQKNQQHLEKLVKLGHIEIRLNSTLHKIEEQKVTFNNQEQHEYDSIIVSIGSGLPKNFLQSIGINLRGQLTRRRISLILFFAIFTYLFYLLKAGLQCTGENAIPKGLQCLGGQWINKKDFFPFSLHNWSELPTLLQVDLGFRVVDGAFWGTVCYSALITIFGIRALYKYPSKKQRKRYTSLILFQFFFLFGIPEIIAPILINAGESSFWWNVFGGDRPGKFYSLSVPWPLNIWAVIDSPHWMSTKSSSTALLWMGSGAFVSFVLIPLYVKRYGQGFCSYICGCGGLAETLGDMWRELAPRGRDAKRLENLNRYIFLAATIVTLLILVDAWKLISSGALYHITSFAQHWYSLMIDFWLANVIGVAFYPYLGNRVWCRYACPLRAYMEILAKRFSKVAIESNDRCIGCGECTRYCQMGIPVQRFAQQEILIDNRNSACIQCGICIEVCPMNVLSISQAGQPVTLNPAAFVAVPIAPWEQTTF